MNQDEGRFDIADEAAMERFAACLAPHLQPGSTLTLSGELAAGKTTLTRALLRALGHRGKVKSPTFTLVESYELPGFTLHHFDLYRLADPSELYYLGFDDLQMPGAVCVIEWPARAGDALTGVDLALTLEILGPDRRRVVAHAFTATGRALLAACSAAAGTQFVEHGSRPRTG